MTQVLTVAHPIRLKGRSFLALVLAPELPIGDWLARLDDLVGRSAGYFLGRPIVLDIDGLDFDGSQLRELMEKLYGRGIRILGIEGADAEVLSDDLPPAISGGLAAFEIGATKTEASVTRRSDAVAAVPKPSLMITQPVRSGQMVTSEGDITVIGSVASGADVIAGGSVHIYGTARGRVAAGAMGDATARIFCHRLEAELVAIAGYYKTSEDLDPELKGLAVQLWLETDSIFAKALG